jgi:mono/diheme cytochrome c family protein
VFQPNCVRCHGNSQASAGINLESYDSLQASNLAHGHPIVIPGNPEGSHLFETVASGEMPLGGPRLPDSQIAILKAWIQNGAKND